MKKAWMNIVLGALLILITIILFFIVLHLSTWMHEKAHVREAYKQGIAFKYYVNILNITNGDAIGGSYPASEKECEKFNMLPKKAQETIRYAGVKQEMIILLPLFLVSLVFTVRFWIKHVRQHPYIAVLLSGLTLVFLLVMFIGILSNIFLPPCTLNNWRPNDWLAGNFTNCLRFG